MIDTDLQELDNAELIELLTALEGLDDALCEQEKLLKEGEDSNEN